MKKKNKNKARKSITAVGAVVAAGLTPGIATGMPAPQSSIPGVLLTAADAVSINGEVFDFDELFAMQQVNRDQVNTPKVYGPLPSKKNKEEKARQDSIRRAQEKHKVVYGPPPVDIEKAQQEAELEKARQEAEREKAQIEAMREAARRDSIRRAEEEHKLVYGPPPVRYVSLDPEEVRTTLSTYSKEDAIIFVENKLEDYISVLTDIRRSQIDQDFDLTRDLRLSPEELTDLLQELENSYGVLLTEDMLKQLNTTGRLARFIVEVIKPIEN